MQQNVGALHVGVNECARIDDGTIDVALRREVNNGARPMLFKHLRVVAFLQNDQTKEVLQAVQVEVPAEGSAQ